MPTLASLLLNYPRGAAALSILLVGSIAAADYATGYELRLAVLYLVPVFLATWSAGRLLGSMVAIASALSWLLMFRSSHPYSEPIYYYWEGVILCATLVAFAQILGRLRRALKNADERFATVLEGLDAAVYVHDIDSGAMLYVNHRFQEFFADHGNACNAHQFETSFEATPPDFISRSVAAQVNSKALRGEIFDRRSDRWFLVYSRVIRWVGGRAVGLKVLTEITEFKQAEAAGRAQVEKLQMSSKLLSIAEMASALSHELNQPLTAIASSNQACVRLLRSAAPDPALLLETMEKCAAQAVRAGEIVNRIREFVRKREPTRSAQELNAILQESLRLIAPEVAASGVSVTFDLAPGLPPIFADAIMIQQVLVNLIRNGIEAMQQTASGSRHLFIASQRSGHARLSVSIRDTGSGIPVEIEPKLYTPFFSTKQGGMGIGLNISRSIIEFHGGKLWHESASDGGSIFGFTLPALTA